MAVLGIGSLFATTEAISQSGGRSVAPLAGGRPLGGPPIGVRPLAGAPAPVRSFAPSYPKHSLHKFQKHGFHKPPRHHHRRIFGGFGFVAPYVYNDFYPNDAFAPDPYLTDANPPLVSAPIRPALRPIGCHLQSEMVPAAHGGGLRKVNIWRCY